MAMDDQINTDRKHTTKIPNTSISLDDSTVLNSISSKSI